MSDERTKMMIRKLVEQFESGFIVNEWAENFVFDLKIRVDKGQKLTPKQLNKLEEIYEKY